VRRWRIGCCGQSALQLPTSQDVPQGPQAIGRPARHSSSQISRNTCGKSSVCDSNESVKSLSMSSTTSLDFSPQVATATPRQRSVIEPIQYLRGLAAVLVLLHHVAFKLTRYPVDPLRWLHCGDIGVDVFFVISGFVITHSVRGKHGSAASVNEFLRGRIARIIPLYWLLTVVANAVFIAAPSFVNSSGGTTNIVASYFLLPTDDKYLVQNGWTLAYEFYFYALFASALLLPRAAGRGLVVTILCLLGSSNIVLTPHGPVQQFLLSPMLLEFAGGILLYLMYERAVGLAPWVRLALAGIALTLWILVNAGQATGIRVLDYGVASWFLCLAAVARRQDAAPLRWEVPHWLGDVSFSLYLIHPFVVAGVVIVLSHAPEPIRHRSDLAMCLALAGSVAAAGIVYRWIEQPLTRAARHVLHRQEVRTMPTRASP